MVIIKISMETRLDPSWTQWLVNKIEEKVIEPNGMLIPEDLKIEISKEVN